MSREKQIEEMAQTMCEECACYSECDIKGICDSVLESADTLYRAGYRKQNEGEWRTVVDNKNDIVTECSACKKQFWFMKKGQLNIDRMPYCPNCGAKMKGGE